MITGIYLALFAIAQAIMVVWIARTRMTEKVSLGAGDSDVLERKVRVYGNFIEVVPLAVLLMLVAELSGAPHWIIHWMGMLMVLSRISHAKGLLTPPGYGAYRMAGMLLVMAVYLIGAALCVTLALPHMN